LVDGWNQAVMLQGFSLNSNPTPQKKKKKKKRSKKENRDKSVEKIQRAHCNQNPRRIFFKKKKKKKK
jgi:hypothetical protein